MARTDTRHPSSHRRVWRLVGALLGLALLSVGGCFAWQKMGAGDGKNGHFTFADVQRGNIEDLVTATGTLQPRDFVEVGAQVSGQITKIHVEVGSQVEAGDLLAEIDPTLFMARVDATRAQLRSQRAQLEDRRSQLALAEIQHTRQKNLMAEDATTMDALQVAEASVRSARAQIEALRAQIDQTESTLRAEEANLQYARIFAPMTGTVVSINARQGQTINASQQAPVILRIADLSTMTVQTQVSEADVGKLRVGMDAYFTTLGGQGKRWYGTLRRIEPTPEVQNNVVLYNALFDVPNSDNALMTQMTAQVFFVSASAQDALVVPMSALSLKGQGPPRSADPANNPSRTATLRVVLPSGETEERQVKIGVSNRVQAEILSGLAEGDRIVTGSRTANPTAASGGRPGAMPGMGGARLR